jgi:hypothetical protein
MTKWHRFALIPLLLTLAACGSGGNDGSGVASLDNDGASVAPSASASADVEKEVTAYVECLRKNGANVPDPVVDAKGRLSFGRMPAGQTVDRDKIDAAQKVCGKPPASLMQAAQDMMQDPAFQDAAVKFTECMRGEGINVPDPDFATLGQGQSGGLFGQIDRDDPKVAAAVKACQHVWTDAGLQPRGGGN